MSISSFITLPEPAINFSKINLPNTSLIDKAHLNNIFLNYWEFLRNNTKLKNVFIEDENQSILFNEKNFVNNIKNYVFSLDLENKKSIHKSNLYKKFLEIIIPKSRVIFNLMKKFISGKLSIVDVVSYLEPFLIYPDNITYNLYLDITSFIDREIDLYNQKFIERSKEFYYLSNIKSSTLNVTNAFPVIYNIRNDAERSELFDAYNVNIANLLTKTNSEILKELIVTDSNRYYTALLSKNNIPLMIAQELDKLVDSEDEFINKKCEVISIAKSYKNEEELFNDNDITIYFDKRFDKTNYDLLNNYEQIPLLY